MPVAAPVDGAGHRAKMLLTDVYKVPIGASLAVIALILAASVAASLLFPKAAMEHDPVEHDPLQPQPEPDGSRPLLSPGASESRPAA